MRGSLLLAALATLIVSRPAYSEPLPNGLVEQSLGVNIHFTTSEPKQLDLIKASGVRFVRMDFSWNDIEKKKGEYDWSKYDQLVESMVARDIRLLFILDYGNDLYDGGVAPRDDATRGAFVRFVAAAAKRYAGKPIWWEIWNEPNILPFWRPKPNAEDYCKLAIPAIDAVRAADKNATVIGPASAGIPLEYYKVLGERGVLAKFDAITTHPYRQENPELAAEEYQRLRLLLSHYVPGKRLPIFSGEWGYSTGWVGYDENKQARCLARQRLFNLACGVNLSTWYDWRDDGDDPKEPEHHFGIVFRDFKLKPAFEANRTIASVLEGMRFQRRLAIGSENDWVLVFSDAKNANSVIAAWTTGPDTTVRVPLPPGKHTLHQMTGAVEPFAAVGREAELKLTGEPQYIQVAASLPGPTADAMWVVEAGKPLAVQGAADSRTITDLTGHVVARGAGALDTTYDRRDQESIPAILADPAGGPGARVTLLVRNAVRISVLPPNFKSVVLLVENPSGQALEATLTARAGQVSGRGSLVLKSGQTSAQVTLTADIDFPTGQSIQLRGESGGRVVLAPPAVTWRRALEGNDPWLATLGGDDKLKGDIQVRAADLADPQLPGFKRCMEMLYRVPPGWKYAEMKAPASLKPIEGKPAQLGFWFYGDASGNNLRAKFTDSTGQTFQHTYGPITWSGWRWVSMPFNGKGAGFWGGAKDGTVHYPIVWETPVLVDSISDKTDVELTVRATGFGLGY